MKSGASAHSAALLQHCDGPDQCTAHWKQVIYPQPIGNESFMPVDLCYSENFDVMYSNETWQRGNGSIPADRAQSAAERL